MDKNFFSIILIVLGYVLMEVVKSLEKRAKRAKRTSTSEGNGSTVSNEEGVDDVYEANGTEEVTPAMGGGGREELGKMLYDSGNDALGSDELGCAGQEGLSYSGYMAGGGIISDVSEPLGSVPEEEGGEGLAAKRAAALLLKEKREKLQRLRHQKASIGREVLGDARKAMIATFVLEPKFARRMRRK
jgi:hypothetical protein